MKTVRCSRSLARRGNHRTADRHEWQSALRFRKQTVVVTAVSVVGAGVRHPASLGRAAIDREFL